MAKGKLALSGLNHVRIFPVSKNDTEGYEVGDKVSLPEATQMSREDDVASQKFYSDDALYYEAKNWNGVKLTIGFNELPFELRAQLGDGEFDKSSGVYTWAPNSQKPEVALACACQYIDNGGWEMIQIFSFQINEVKQANIQSRGDNITIAGWEIVGTCTARKIDGKVGRMKMAEDIDDLMWMDEFPAPTAP